MSFTPVPHPFRPQLLFPTLLLLVTLFGVTPVAAETDARALEIAERTFEAMGGEEGWQSARFLRFNFFGFRTHHWDRHTGRHRLEGKSREGDTYVVLQNLGTRQGDAWVNGEKVSDEEKASRLEGAHAAWINDTYWLLMPYKLRDPGVHLAYDGEEKIDGVTYDKLHLSFDGVGLTPGDQYWAYINRETGLMDRWAYFLQDWEEGREPTVWLWQEWDQYGPLVLSPKRFNPADDRTAELSDLAVLDSVPDALFESP